MCYTPQPTSNFSIFSKYGNNPKKNNINPNNNPNSYTPISESSHNRSYQERNNNPVPESPQQSKYSPSQPTHNYYIPQHKYSVPNAVRFAHEDLKKEFGGNSHHNNSDFLYGPNRTHNTSQGLNNSVHVQSVSYPTRES